MNLGFTLDCHLTMNAHVSNIARTCYFELRRWASIRRILTSTATATLVSAFVLSRIDYCNSLLFGSTHDVTPHLQRRQLSQLDMVVTWPLSNSILDLLTTTNPTLANNIETHTGISDHLLFTFDICMKPNIKQSRHGNYFTSRKLTPIISHIRSSTSLKSI